MKFLAALILTAGLVGCASPATHQAGPTPDPSIVTEGTVVGSEADLETVTNIGRSMAGRWGMSERIGTFSVLPAEGDPRMAGVSDALLDAVDQEVRRITEECYADARRLLRENRGKLDAIVAQLLLHESLDEPEIYAAAGIARPAAPQPPSPVPA